MNGTRLSLALLAAALPLAACGQRDAASTPTTSSVTASSVAPSSSAPAASASAAPPRPAPIPPVPMPAAYQRFAEALDKKCAPEDSDGSTAGMAAAEAARDACIAKGIKVDAARLPIDELAVLLDGDPRSPRGKSRDPRGSVWTRTTDAACRAAGFQQWTDGADKNLGSYEQVRVHACFGHADSDFAYLARTRLEKRAPDWAEYVQAVARSRPDPALAMKRWRRHAGLARRTAPHSLWGCRPMVCRRTDIEWIEHERDLEIVAEGAESLAKALCSSWPELGTAFGGEAACRERMAAHWLPTATHMGGELIDPPAEDAEAVAASQDLPPPADEAYDRATYAPRHRCPVDKQRTCAEEEHQKARSDPALVKRAEVLAWDKKLGPLRDRLCTLDEAGEWLSVSNRAAPWLAPPMKSGVCRGTATLLTAHVLRLLAAGDLAGLEKHLSAREQWGLAVERGLDAVGTRFAASCEGEAPKDCAAVVKRVREIAPELAAAGALLCKASPELEKAMGEGTCARVAGRYLLSFAVSLGRSDLLGH